jgi:hypothetical protein
MLKIIFKGYNNQLSVMMPTNEFMASLTGTEEEKLRHAADKDLPTGTKYEIIDSNEMPNDVTFFDAWEYVAGSDEKTSDDLSLDDQLKYNHITQEEFDNAS